MLDRSLVNIIDPAGGGGVRDSEAFWAHRTGVSEAKNARICFRYR